MSELITHKEKDGTLIVFSGSQLHNSLKYSDRKHKLFPLVKSAFKKNPRSQFWYDANEFVKSILKQ